MSHRIVIRRAAVACSFAVVTLLAGDAFAAEQWKKLIAPSQVHLRAIAESGGEGQSAEALVRSAIRAANGSFALDELTTIVRISAACCKESKPVSAALTQLLRESHPIYVARLPTQASQFRGFLLASLGSFAPNDELYSYVKSEFLFGGHPFGIAAAAVAARNFADRSEELLPLMEPYLGSAFDDRWVDITTTELNYPLANPTRARHEIIRTLIVFGPRAYRSLPQLDAVTRCPNCGSFGADPALARQAAQAAEHIRKVTPPCCRKAAAATAGAPGLKLIDKRQRKPFATPSLKLLDQEGRSLEFAALRGRPFALSFFYSQCTNGLKCVLTVRRLGALAAACAEDDLADKVGVYGMTYDPQFDAPAILKKYGTMHGMKFGRNVRLLKTAESLADSFRDQLALRVSYGAGSVNQHGMQLFVFDKHGRLAAIQDNELWSPTDVKNSLARLAAE